MAKSTLKFVDELPPSTREKTKWDETVRQLRANPGRWAVIDDDANTGKASTLRAHKAFQPRAEFEIQTRPISDKRVAIYARFVQPEPTPV